VAQTLENYLEDQSTYYQAEYRLRTRSGRYMWIMGRGEVALRDEHGTPLRMTGVHIDIDERMRAQAKLEKRKESLDRLVKQKTERLRQALRDTEEHAAAARDASTEKAQLLARLAREFRSPIAHIAERLGDLANTSLSPEQKRIADDLRKTGGAMHAVTDDMLELYCIESGKIELDHTAFDLRKCLEETMRTLNTLAEQKGLDLLLRYPPRIPSMVRGDNHRFGQIFLNLVGRAIAFTECGHVLVTVNTSEEDDTSARFVIRVQGSSEAQNQENSRAADAAQARWPSLRRYGRTGIGLYIARGLAELMDAELDPERRSGTGTLSRFAVTLPVLAAPDIETLSDGLAASPVLIVSDRPLTSRLSGEALSQRGFRNVTGCRADNAAALLSRAEQSGAPIRLVLVDLKWSTRPNATVQFAGTVSVTGSSPLLAAVIPASCDTRILRDAGYRTCLRRPVFPEDVFDCVLDLLDTE
jgi:signal transduction histidine kinase